MGYSFEADRYQIRQFVDSYYSMMAPDRYEFIRTRKNLGEAHVQWVDMLANCLRQLYFNDHVSHWENKDFINGMLLGAEPDGGSYNWFASRDSMSQSEDWEQHVSRATVDRFDLDANIGEAVLEFFCEEEEFEPPQALFLRNKEVQDALIDLDSWVIFGPNSVIDYRCTDPIHSITWDRSDAPGLILCALYVEAVNAYVAGKNLKPVTPSEMLRDLLSATVEKKDGESLRFNPAVDVEKFIAAYQMPPTQVQEVVSATYPTNVWRHEIKGPYTLSIETPEDGVTVLTVTTEKE